MASFDKFLYSFAKYKKLDRMKLTGYSKAVGAGATVNVLLTNSADKVLYASGLSVPGSVAGYAKGCIFILTNAADGTKAIYENQGDTTTASFNLIGGTIATADLEANAVTSGKIAAGVLQVASVTLSAAEICTATTIKTLIAAPATGYFINVINATLSYKYGAAGFGGGGNLTIGLVGGAAVTGIVSAANSFGATADKLVIFTPLAVTATAITKETAIGLQTSGTFTLGSATGTGLVTITYQVLPIA